MEFVGEHARSWAADYISRMKRIWAVRTGSVANQVLEILAALDDDLPNLVIDTTGFP
jgi:hypothetical protein